MKICNDGTISFSGRIFTRADLDEIKDITETFSALSRTEIAGTVCECLNWYRANGKYKQRECYEFLNLLEQQGIISLPALKRTKPRGSRTCIQRTLEGERQCPVSGTVNDVMPVTVHVVRNREEQRLWRELVERYHYLGFKVPFGAHIRYFFNITEGSKQRLGGCLQFSSPAWRIACRDQWIGWDDAVRRVNLQYIINNSRFLILPWISIRNLASKVLSLTMECVEEDWAERYGIRPVLAETMVDPARYSGTCYKASNWMELGKTTGRGRMDRANKRQNHCPKKVYVYPLRRDFQNILKGV